MIAFFIILLMFVVGLGLIFFGYLIDYREDSLGKWIDRKLNPDKHDPSKKED